MQQVLNPQVNLHVGFSVGFQSLQYIFVVVFRFDFVVFGDGQGNKK